MLVTMDMQAFAQALAPRQRLLGVDLGRKRIGLALSDVTRRIASPHKILPHRSAAQSRRDLHRLIESEAIGGVVVGLALHMHGGMAPQAQSARAFATHLARLTACPVYLQDERLSSAGAARILQRAGLSRAKQTERLDAMAAAWILQIALDALNSQAQTTPRPPVS